MPNAVAYAHFGLFGRGGTQDAPTSERLEEHLDAEIRMWNGRLHDPEWLDVAEAYLGAFQSVRERLLGQELEL